jgi:hypothetical protein
LQVLHMFPFSNTSRLRQSKSAQIPAYSRN